MSDERKKTLTDRVKDLELVAGGILRKWDQLDLETVMSKVDLFGDPRRAGLAWSAAEKKSFIHAFLTFIEARSKYHQRSIDAMLAYLQNNGLLREEELRRKHEKLSHHTGPI